jgi:hypothetical protein
LIAAPEVDERTPQPVGGAIAQEMPPPLPSSLIEAVSGTTALLATCCALVGLVMLTPVAVIAMLAETACRLSVTEVALITAVQFPVRAGPAVYVTPFRAALESEPQPVAGFTVQLTPPVLKSFAMLTVIDKREPSLIAVGGAGLKATVMFGLIVMAGAVSVFDGSVTELTVATAPHCAAGAAGGVYRADVPDCTSVPQLPAASAQVTPALAPSLVIVEVRLIAPLSAYSVTGAVGDVIASTIAFTV